MILFHLKVPGFDGGYVGVDIFFVISGFLISGLIRDRVETGTFSFSDFYARRISRLLPAVLATVGATAIAAIFILQPDALGSFALSAAAAVFSAANFVFYFESGYWDASAELKPLLHLWSLGIEEQFYLFWPLFFKFFKKFSFKILLYLLGAIVLVKLIVLVLSDFYLLNNLKNFFSMMKFENMIVGALGALILKNNISKTLNLIYNPFVFFSSIVGIFLSIYITPDLLKDGLHIIHSIFFIIIILNISTNKKYFSILESKYLNLLGTISYGIYMYHMIVIYFVIKFITDYDFLDINSFYGFLSLYGSTISITILISYFSYYYFEIKFLNLKSSLINSLKP